jgi:hypothetical protein
VDVDLAQPVRAGIVEPVWLLGRHDHDPAGRDDALVLAVGERRLSFENEEQLAV